MENKNAKPSPVNKPPKTIVDHAVRVLEISGKFLDSISLITWVLEAGCASGAKNPRGSVQVALSDELRKKSPRIVKMDNKYGLPDWVEIKTPSKRP